MESKLAEIRIHYDANGNKTVSFGHRDAFSFQYKASVEERVRQIVVEQLGVGKAKVTPNASFVDDLGGDELDKAELVMAFEETFEVRISDEYAFNDH